MKAAARIKIFFLFRWPGLAILSVLSIFNFDRSSAGISGSHFEEMSEHVRNIDLKPAVGTRHRFAYITFLLSAFNNFAHLADIRPYPLDILPMVLCEAPFHGFGPGKVSGKDVIPEDILVVPGFPVTFPEIAQDSR